MNDANRLVGVRGVAERIPVDPGNPKHVCTVDHWLLTLPNQHPLWNQYMLGAIHLRDVEGFPPAVKRHPDATHEIMLVALNPELGTLTVATLLEAVDGGKPVHLTPANVVEHIRNAADDEVRRLCFDVAHIGLLGGHLPAEPEGIRGARELWAATLENTLEHIRHGGHADAGSS